MADETRRVFVEIVIDDAAAKARLVDVDRGVAQLGKTAKQATADFHALFEGGGKGTGAVDAQTAATKKYADALHQVTVKYADQEKGLVQFNNIVRTYGRDLTAAGMSLSLFVTAPLVAASAAVLKLASDFEKSMTKVVTLSMVSEQNMAGMRKEILEMAPAVGIGPGKLAEALLQVTSTGIRGMEAMEVLKVAAKGSAIGLGDVTTVAKTLTSVMAAYGAENITAAQAGNVLYKMVVEGKGELTEFAGALGRVVGMAAMVGVSMADAGAFIATFTRTGGSAAEAVTALRGVLLRLEVKETANTREALKGLGMTIEELRGMIADKGLTPTLVDLIHKFGATNQVLGVIFPNIRALAGAMTVAGAQAQSAVEIYKHLTSTMDEMSPAFDRTGQTIAFRWEQVKAHFEVVAITLGEKLFPTVERLIPIMDRMIDKAAGLVQWFGELPGPIQDTAIAALALAAAAGPLMIMIGGVARLVNVYLDYKIAAVGFKLSAAASAEAMVATTASAATATTVVSGLGAATTAAAGTFLGLTAPVWAVIGAVTALGIAVDKYASDSTKALLSMTNPIEVTRKMWSDLGDSVGRDLKNIGVDVAIIAWRGLKKEVEETADTLRRFYNAIPGLPKMPQVDVAAGTSAIHTLAEGVHYLATAEERKAEADKKAWSDVVLGSIKSHTQSTYDAADANAALGKAVLEGAKAAEVISGTGLPAVGLAAAENKDAWEALRGEMVQYRQEIAALSGEQRGDLARALKEGALSASELSTRLGISASAVQWFSRQTREAATEQRAQAKETEKSEKVLDSWAMHMRKTTAGAYAEAMEGLEKWTAGQQVSLVKQAEMLFDFQRKNAQAGQVGVTARLSEIAEQERAHAVSAEAIRTKDAGLWTAMMAEAQKYYAHLRDLATGSASTLEERMEAMGIHSKRILGELASRAKTTYEQMLADGTKVWTSQQIEGARQKMVEANAEAAGQIVYDWKTQLGELGGILSTMFAGINSSIGQAMQVVGNTLEILVSKSVTMIGKVTAALAGAAQIAQALGSDLAASGFGGAAAGASIGFMLGGPTGAGIGAGLGAILGVFGALDAGSKKMREENAAATAQIGEMQQALVKQYGSMERVAKISELVGEGLEHAWGHKGKAGLAAWQTEVEEFQRALEDLDARLVGVAASVTALSSAEIEKLRQLRAVGYESDTMRTFTDSQQANITKGAAGLVNAFAAPHLADMQALDDYAEKWEDLDSKVRDYQAKIADMAAKGGPTTELQKRNLVKWQQAIVELNWEIKQLGIEYDIHGKAVEEFTKNGQEAFDRYGRIATTAFAAAMAGGASFLGALSDLAPSFDQLALLMTKFGFKASETLQTLLGWTDFAKKNPELIASIDSLNQMMTGLWNTGMLNESMFQDLGATASEIFAKMTAQGKGGEQGMRAMQPTLQSLWQIWKDTGWTIDDNTLKLIQNAEEAGIVGEKFKDPARKQVEALESIQRVLGDLTKFFAEDFVQAIYDAFNGTKKRAEDLGKEIDDALVRERRVPVVFDTKEFPSGSEDGSAGTRMHLGGLVGMGNPWAEAPRAHYGLALDEVPIIAQRGERVLSRDDTVRLDRQGGLAGLRRLPTSNAVAGGLTLHQTLTVNAWDASSVDLWLKRGGARKLARAVAPATVAELDSRGLIGRNRG